MFAGLRRTAAALAVAVGASAVCVLTGAPAAQAEPADAGGDFLTVASSPAGGFDNLAPGDTASWFVTARNAAAVDALLSLSVQSDSTSALLTDTVQGLQLRLTACSDEWAGTSADVHCPGERIPIAQGPLALVRGGYRLPAVPAESAAHLLAQITVPRQATNDVAGQAAHLRFEITAVQGEAGSAGDQTPPVSVEPAVAAGPGSDAARPAALAGTGPGHASPVRSLALALLGAGSLVLVLRRLRLD